MNVKDFVTELMSSLYETISEFTEPLLIGSIVFAFNAIFSTVLAVFTVPLQDKPHKNTHIYVIADQLYSALQIELQLTLIIIGAFVFIKLEDF